jgi:N utilization substance protein A
VPEIFDGLIVIRKIVREPGERAKVAVEVMTTGSIGERLCWYERWRIHGIVRELRTRMLT